MLYQKGIPVWIICRNPLIREGLRGVLEENEFFVDNCFDDDDIQVDCGDEANLSNLVIIDCTSSDDQGERFAALRNRYPNAKLLVLSDEFRMDEVVDAFRAGVDGYVLKEISCASLLESLRLIMLGENVLPSEMINHLTKHASLPCAVGGADADVADLLSDREVETLRCLIQGFPNKVIAHRLDISEATVKVHVKAILRKLMVQNRTQAAIWAVNRGLDGGLAGELPQDSRYAEWPIRRETKAIEQIQTHEAA